MYTATESSPSYIPTLKDLQSLGYADWHAEINKSHSKDDQFVFVAPTTEEMESAYSSAARVDDDGQRLMRGVTYHVDVSSSSIRHKPIAFRPDANGEEFYIWPVKEDCRIIDLIWSTTNFDEWGFTTGRTAILGGENLSKTYTVELPLHVYDNPHSYWERTEDEEEDPTTREDAICILKPSARALLPAVGHVQVFHWDDVEDLASFFEDHPERVSAFQDQEAFDAYVKRAARWDRFDHMQAPTPPAGTRLTWAHAKAAIKARRKTNAEIGLDGFEESRARVKARAARPEVSAAINAWHNDPSDQNRRLAQHACMPFCLRDIVFAKMTQFATFDEWLRRRENAGTATRGGPSVASAEPRRDPMFKRIGKLKAKPRKWLIRGLIACNEVGNPFGRPDSFKGVSAAQLCVHIAGGVDFLGLEVKQGPTAYFAAERGEQVKIRIMGHIHRLGLPEDLPCYFGDRPINLLDDKDVQSLLAEIEMMERDAGQPLRFLVIDTQSRTLDGDENTTKDGAKYARAIEIIRKNTSATLLWIISHTGHAENAQGRPRGNSSLLGAYDTFYQHVKENETSGSIKITLDRDGLGQRVFPFNVTLHDTGLTNDDREPVLVPYLEAAGAPAKFIFKKLDVLEPARPTPNETLMLKALRAAIQKSRNVVRSEDAGGNLLEGARYVTGTEWREEFRTLYKTGSTRQAESQAFTKGRDGLVAKGFVDARGSCYWPTVTAPS